MAISTEESPARRPRRTTSIGQAIQEVTDRAQLLVREEIELAKAEVTDEDRQLVKGAVVGVAAGIFIVVALLFVLHGFAWLCVRPLSRPATTSSGASSSSPASCSCSARSLASSPRARSKGRPADADDGDRRGASSIQRDRAVRAPGADDP